MPDIATILDPATFGFDWAMDGPSLESDDGLKTAAIISLFTNKRAPSAAQLPAAQPIGAPAGGGLAGLAAGNMRGWLGDAYLPTLGDQIGSWLWLLAREKATQETRTRAEGYINDALGWMITLGLVASIDVATWWQGLAVDNPTLAARIQLFRPDGTSVSLQFDKLWANS
jgi:phage gp46-like protein